MKVCGCYEGGEKEECTAMLLRKSADIADTGRRAKSQWCKTLAGISAGVAAMHSTQYSRPLYSHRRGA